MAGGVALNELLGGTRISRDVALFHDTERALARTWAADRATLERAGLAVRPMRELAAFVEARVASAEDAVLVQWGRDSAFRFFPLVEHEELGLTLHPLDLAANKTLALVGRLEVRDWVDLLLSTDRIQPLGYLAWAACGKDPGFSPASILEHAGRTTRYSIEELAALEFDGARPDAVELSRRWHAELELGRAIVRALPALQAGKCVLSREGEPYRGDADAVQSALVRDDLVFHAGRIRGAWPVVRAAPPRQG